MAGPHVGGDVGGRTRPDRGTTDRKAARRWAAAVGAACLVLPLTACGGEEPSTDPPDPGAPITRSPS